MPKDVFISYAKEDRASADQVCSLLEAAGISCWIAPRDIAPGLTWPAAIAEAIHQCRAMIVLFSTHANQSPQMAREVEGADRRSVPIIPVRVEDVEPSGDMEYFLGNRQWFDVYGGPIEITGKDLPRAISALLAEPEAGAEAAETGRPARTEPTTDFQGAGRSNQKQPARAGSALRRRRLVAAGAAILIIGVIILYVWRSRPVQVSAPVKDPNTFADVTGRWKAVVKYSWGDTYTEFFKFKVDRTEVSGTASYGEADRGILDGKIEGNRISFTTKSYTMLGDKTFEEKHYYKGRILQDAIDFILQTDSGYDSRVPEQFTAERVQSEGPVPGRPQ